MSEDLAPFSAAPRASIGGRVRRARERDLDRVAALWSAIAEHHAALEPHFALRTGADAEIRALVESVARDPDAAIFVWDREGNLEGVCIVRIDRARPIYRETERAEITDLGVRAGARRRGIGRALVRAALVWVRARGVARVEVRVAARNAEGQGFWRALGYADLMDVLHLRL